MSSTYYRTTSSHPSHSNMQAFESSSTNRRTSTSSSSSTSSSTAPLKRKSPLTSAGAKCRAFLPSLKLSTSSSSSLSLSWHSNESSNAIPEYMEDSETSDDDSRHACEITTPTTTIVTSPNHIRTSSVPARSCPPPIGTKITDRFWPEEDPEQKDDPRNHHESVCKPTSHMLSPPPYHHHRRHPGAGVSPHDDVLSSDKYAMHRRDRVTNNPESLPLKFPF